MDFFFNHQSFQHRNAQPVFVLWFFLLRSFSSVNSYRQMLRIALFALFYSTEISKWILRSEWLPLEELQITSIYNLKRTQAWTCQGGQKFISPWVVLAFISLSLSEGHKMALTVKKDESFVHFYRFAFVPAIHQKQTHWQNDLPKKANLSKCRRSYSQNIFNIHCQKT